MQQHNLIQGSAEWHAFRRQHYTASDAPAMLGVSPYKTRAELLREKATGVAPEVTPAQQRVFEHGHALEADARPVAEAIVGEELFPVVGSAGKLAASFDGLTMLGDVAFEHKTLNQALRYDWDEARGDHLPEHYRAQMEQQLLVSGAERVLFMASERAGDGSLISKHCWYASDPAMRERITAGWAQFERDLQAWQPEAAPATAPVQATPTPSLPAVVVQVQGSLTVGGNLPAFGDALRAFIERIPTQPATDQEFADADAACKTLKRAEDALEQAETSALAQISDVEAMRRAVADLRSLARSTRLATEKLVKAEKEARKTARVMQARQQFAQRVQELQGQVQGIGLRVSEPDWAGAIKGLSSLSSIDEKLTAALLAGQAEAEAVARRVAENLKQLDAVKEYALLFADRAELVHKDAETLALIIAQRIEAHQRQEAERQRIRAEEEAQAAKAAQEQTEREAREIAERWANERRWSEMNGPRLDCRAETETVAPIAEPPAAQPETPPTLRLGEINQRIAPLSITAEGMAQLGFEPAGKDRRAVLYHASRWPAMCAVIVRHVQAASGLTD